MSRNPRSIQGCRPPLLRPRLLGPRLLGPRLASLLPRRYIVVGPSRDGERPSRDPAHGRRDAGSWQRSSAATGTRPGNFCLWSMTSCASWPPPRLAREARGSRSRPPRWCTRRTSGSSGPIRASTSMAAATFSPRPPRPCDASWSTRAGPQTAQAGRRPRGGCGSTSTPCSSSHRATTCWLSTRP